MATDQKSIATLRRNPWERRFSWLLVAVLFVARVPLLLHRVYDVDEFEHLHAGLSVWRGEVPYRDFFEHHGPLTYYLTASLVGLAGATPSLLTANRLFSLAFLVVTLVGTWAQARRLGGRRAARWSLVWLLSWPLFNERSIEWRPDVIAIAALAIAGWIVVARGNDQRPKKGKDAIAGLVAGALIGLASLATLKIAPFVVGSTVGLVIVAGRARGGRILASGLAGAIIPWAIALGGFAFARAGQQFLYCTVWLPVTWTTPGSGEYFPGEPSTWSPGHLGFAAAALLVSLSSVIRRRPESVLALGVATQLAAAMAAPAVYLQFFLPAMPPLAILASSTASRWVRQRRFVVIALAVVAGFAISGPRYFELWIAQWPIVRADFHARNIDPINWFWIIDMAAIVLLGAGAIAFGARPTRGVAKGIAAAALLVAPLGRMGVYLAYSDNRPQRDDLLLVNALAGPDGKVMDGFSGLGCLRPHASYWWWINLHTAKLMDGLGGWDGVNLRLIDRDPSVVIFDAELQRFGTRITRELLSHYRPTTERPKSTPAILFVPAPAPADH